MCPTNISYRKYTSKDFEDVFKLFLKFQAKAKLSQHHSICKDQKPIFFLPYLNGELKKIIKDHKYHYVGIDTDTNTIIAYACFHDSSLAEEAVDLILVFKDETIPYNKFLKYLLLLTMHNEFPNKRIFACLNKRDKYDKYVNFMKKCFKINVMRKDQFDRVYIEFLK
jgi:hypothetical protein